MTDEDDDDSGGVGGGDDGEFGHKGFGSGVGGGGYADVTVVVW